MRSFFRRIFFGFWLSAAIVGLVFLGAATTLPQTPLRRWNDLSGGALTIYAQSAADIYERDGASGLEKYLARVTRDAHLRVWFFDAGGTLLSLGPAPPDSGTLVRQAAGGGRPSLHFSPTHIEGTRFVTGGSGAHYVLIGAIYSDGPMGFAALFVRVTAVLLATGLISWRLAFSVAAPVVVLRRAAQRYASGDLTARAGETFGQRRDELGELGRDFDAMAARLEALALAQRRLLGDISHELRSPLARLQVALALARRQPGNDAALDRIEREAERLDSLIGQLLTLTRLEVGLDAEATATVGIARLVREVVEDADFEAHSQDRGVRYTGPGEADADYSQIGNVELLRSAVENVVRNAVRHTAPGTSVEVSLDCSATQILITVRDHGPGVPKEALAEIFRPFRRVGEARERDTGGVGLGLAITERAIHLHSGTVTAENAVGGGLCVTLRLPRVRKSEIVT